MRDESLEQAGEFANLGNIFTIDRKTDKDIVKRVNEGYSMINDKCSNSKHVKG